jgi:hypothetical protein
MGGLLYFFEKIKRIRYFFCFLPRAIFSHFNQSEICLRDEEEEEEEKKCIFSLGCFCLLDH